MSLPTRNGVQVPMLIRWVAVPTPICWVAVPMAIRWVAVPMAIRWVAVPMAIGWVTVPTSIGWYDMWWVMVFLSNTLLPLRSALPFLPFLPYVVVEHLPLGECPSVVGFILHVPGSSGFSPHGICPGRHRAKFLVSVHVASPENP